MLIIRLVKMPNMGMVINYRFHGLFSIPYLIRFSL